MNSKQTHVSNVFTMGKTQQPEKQEVNSVIRESRIHAVQTLRPRKRKL